MNIKIIVSTFLIVFGVISGMMFLNSLNNASPIHAKENLDEFAQCVMDSGSKFYGSFWCGHCGNQKEAFGDSAKLLPYVECATPDSRGQTDECKNAEVTSYPSWDFPDGKRLLGELPFEVIAEHSGCDISV